MPGNPMCEVAQPGSTVPAVAHSPPTTCDRRIARICAPGDDEIVKSADAEPRQLRQGVLVRIFAKNLLAFYGLVAMLLHMNGTVASSFLELRSTASYELHG